MKTQNIYLWFNSILFILLISSCMQSTESMITLSSKTPSQTVSSVTPVLSSISSYTPTALLNAMSYQCLEVAEHPPSDYILKGTLVFNNNDNTDAFLWNNDTKNTFLFPRDEGDRLLDFDVSPDRKHILYQQYSAKTNEQRLVIAMANGQPIWSQVIHSYLWNWFDNERLIGLIVPKNGSPSLFLLDPFSDEQQELRTDYPDSKIFSGDWFPGWKYTKGGLPLYNPTLTSVIYPECNSECQDRLIRGDHGWPIALWDIEKDQAIARITTMDVYGETPFWTPDGKQFIIATNINPNNPFSPANEFLAVNREGEIKQLTHFMDYYKEVNIPDNYSMSPDGKLIAFWVVAKPSQYEGARLATLNMETGTVTNYCIQGDPFLADPLWSPDGMQLLVISQDSQDTNNRRVVLVDLLHNYAAQIAEDVKPVGWMVSP